MAGSSPAMTKDGGYERLPRNLLQAKPDRAIPSLDPERGRHHDRNCACGRAHWPCPRPRARRHPGIPNQAAQRADRHRRRHVPRATATGHRAARLFRPAQCRRQHPVVRGAVAGAVARACRVRGRNLLGRHPVCAKGAVGGGALDWTHIPRHPWLHRTPAGGAPDRAADHQPHRRHHQEHRARHGHWRPGNPQPGHQCAVLLRQRHTADDGRGCLHHPVRSGGRARPLPRDAFRVAEELMEALIHQFFNLDIMTRAVPLVLQGLRQTVLLCLIVIPLGLIGGLLFALASLSGSRAVRWGMILAIDFFRAVPPLVLLIFVYSGLPFAGIRLSPLAAVALAFFLNTSSYYGEIYRAGIESVGRGQWDAARSTGLSAFHTLISVVLPQAIRNVLPDLVSNTVEVVKLTSIASVVALPELLYSADMARSLTFNASPIVLAAAIYLVMLWPVVRLVSRLERRFGP